MKNIIKRYRKAIKDFDCDLMYDMEQECPQLLKLYKMTGKNNYWYEKDRFLKMLALKIRVQSQTIGYARFHAYMTVKKFITCEVV